MSRKKNHRIALTDKFSIIAAHHWLKVITVPFALSEKAGRFNMGLYSHKQKHDESSL
jgi:hypothetical protein